MTTTTQPGANLRHTARTVLAHACLFPLGTSSAKLKEAMQRTLRELPAGIPKTMSNLATSGYLVNANTGGGPGWWVPTTKAMALGLPTPQPLPGMDGPQAAQTTTGGQHPTRGTDKDGAPLEATVRQAVEAALRAAGHAGASGRQLATKTGFTTQAVNQVLRRLVAKGKAQRVGQGSTPKVVLLSELARAETTQREQRGKPLRNSTTGQPLTATWLRSHSDRPGANDAFTLPSLVGGVRHAPQKPMSMGTGAGRAAMAIGGGWRFAE